MKNKTKNVNRMSRRDFLRTTGAVVFSGGVESVMPGSHALHPAPRDRVRPNILLFFPDQFRYDWAGWNARIPVLTPNLDSLAGRGARFTRAVVPSPLCAPSRACLATGKEYDRCGVRSNEQNFPLAERTVYSLLRDAGYHVTGCGKFDLHKATKDWGLEGKHLLAEWGFSDGIDNGGKYDAVLPAIRNGHIDPKEPYLYFLQRRNLAKLHVEDFKRRQQLGIYRATFPTALPDWAYCDNWVAKNGLELLKKVPRGKPWYLVVNFVGPHGPMDITRRMEKTVRGRVFPQPVNSDQYTPEVHLAIRQNYSAIVENIDRWVGIYSKELEQRGELDRTLIVFASDHGEMLGDHDRWAKNVPYQPSVGVPLVLAGPGVRSNLVSAAPASTVDLSATFLDYAGLGIPDGMDSRSLKPLLEGNATSHRDHVFSALGGWQMVFDGRYKLVRGFDPNSPKLNTELSPGDPEVRDLPSLLFDLDEDPWEIRNIANRSPGEVRRLSEVLMSRRATP